MGGGDDNATRIQQFETLFFSPFAVRCVECNYETGTAQFSFFDTAQVYEVKLSSPNLLREAMAAYKKGLDWESPVAAPPPPPQTEVSPFPPPQLPKQRKPELYDYSFVLAKDSHGLWFEGSIFKYVSELDKYHIKFSGYGPKEDVYASEENIVPRLTQHEFGKVEWKPGMMVLVKSLRNHRGCDEVQIKAILDGFMLQISDSTGVVSAIPRVCVLAVLPPDACGNKNRSELVSAL